MLLIPVEAVMDFEYPKRGRPKKVREQTKTGKTAKKWAKK